MRAFGGVATGNINAIDAPKVAGKTKKVGFILTPELIEIKIGTIIDVTAVFEVTSVNNSIKITTTNISNKGEG